MSLFVFEHDYGGDPYLLDNTPGSMDKPHETVFKNLPDLDSFSCGMTGLRLSGAFVE